MGSTTTPSWHRSTRSPATTRSRPSPTFLGAHSVPPEFDDSDSYLDFVIADVLPEAAGSPRRPTCSWSGARSPPSRPTATCGRRPHVGWRCACTATSSVRPGGPLAIELGARSVDHLEATGPGRVEQLAGSDVAAVVLPVAALYLRRSMPPARALIDSGAIVALATDFNPGSAFCDSLPLVMTLACTEAGMTPSEALAACTVNAAWVLGRSDRLGRLAPGYDADIVLLDAPDWRYISYHLSGADIRTVIKRGRVL